MAQVDAHASHVQCAGSWCKRDSGQLGVNLGPIRRAAGARDKARARARARSVLRLWRGGYQAHAGNDHNARVVHWKDGRFFPNL